MFYDKTSLPNWLKMVFDYAIYVVFLGFVISSIYPYIDILLPRYKIICLTLISLVYITIIIKLKSKITILLNIILERISKISKLKLIFIIISMLVFFRIFYQFFWFFDSTKDGDIRIYSDIAREFYNFGKISYSGEYPHLVATGIFLSLFLFMGIDLSVGVFLLFSIGTIFYYLTFEKIIGKEKAFLGIFVYLIMPSTGLYTLCVAHEIYFYFFMSLILYIFVGINLGSIKKINRLLLCVALVLLFATSFLVGMMTPVLFIVFVIFIIFSSYKVVVKGSLILLLVLSLVLNHNTRLQLNNNYLKNPSSGSIPAVYNLLIGANYKVDGRDTFDDHTTEATTLMALNGWENNHENFIKSCNVILLERYEYLITHPTVLLDLLLTKFYIAWSGDHYSIELAQHYRLIEHNPTQVKLISYGFLGVSNILYLLIVSIGFLYSKPKKFKNVSDEIYVIKCLLLGVVCVLLIVEIMNKYSTYMTPIIFLLGCSFIPFEKNKTVL